MVEGASMDIWVGKVLGLDNRDGRWEVQKGRTDILFRLAFGVLFFLFSSSGLSRQCDCRFASISNSQDQFKLISRDIWLIMALLVW